MTGEIDVTAIATLLVGALAPVAVLSIGLRVVMRLLSPALPPTLGRDDE